MRPTNKRKVAYKGSCSSGAQLAIVRCLSSDRWAKGAMMLLSKDPVIFNASFTRPVQAVRMDRTISVWVCAVNCDAAASPFCVHKSRS